MDVTAKEMSDCLDEHFPYEVAMLFVTHDVLYPQHRLSPLELNIVIEACAMHARNLLEFFTKTEIGKDRYAFARMFVSDFMPFKDKTLNGEKDALFRKICAQISHLTFNRVKDSPDKFRSDHEVPEAKRMLEKIIRDFVKELPPHHRKDWDLGVAKCGLQRWGF